MVIVDIFKGIWFYVIVWCGLVIIESIELCFCVKLKGVCVIVSLFCIGSCCVKYWFIEYWYIGCIGVFSIVYKVDWVIRYFYGGEGVVVELFVVVEIYVMVYIFLVYVGFNVFLVCLFVLGGIDIELIVIE